MSTMFCIFAPQCVLKVCQSGAASHSFVDAVSSGKTAQQFASPSCSLSWAEHPRQPSASHYDEGRMSLRLGKRLGWHALAR
eukprot:1498535-Rhodomonas_salina.2